LEVRFVKRERSFIASNPNEAGLRLTIYEKLGNDEADRAVSPGRHKDDIVSVEEATAVRILRVVRSISEVSATGGSLLVQDI
jgi:hypothetical protein